MVVGLAVAAGLLLLKRAAWVLTMLWVGLVMGAELSLYLRGEDANYVVMLVSIAQVFYLNLADVQGAFAENSLGQDASMTAVHPGARKAPRARRQPSDLELLRQVRANRRVHRGRDVLPDGRRGLPACCSLTARGANGDSQPSSRQAGSPLTGWQEQRQRRIRGGPWPCASSRSRWAAATTSTGAAAGPEFRARGRLARVGLFGRLADALFRLSFFARGRVPGGTAAAAQLQYEAIRA